jgi:glucose/arabinose dehydrogenase
MGIGFGGTPGGLRIDMYDITDDGLSIGSVIHMPVGVSDRFRGLEMGYDNNLYVTTDSGNIMKISAE